MGVRRTVSKDPVNVIPANELPPLRTRPPTPSCRTGTPAQVGSIYKVQNVKGGQNAVNLSNPPTIPNVHNLPTVPNVQTVQTVQTAKEMQQELLGPQEMVPIYQEPFSAMLSGAVQSELPEKSVIEEPYQPGDQLELEEQTAERTGFSRSSKNLYVLGTLILI